MAHLDRFIDVVFRAGAERLVLRPDEKVMIASGDDLRPVTAQPTTLPQVMQLLREVAPAYLAEAMSQADSCEFEYTAPAGLVRVLVQQDSGTVRIEISPEIESVGAANAAPTTTARADGPVSAATATIATPAPSPSQGKIPAPAPRAVVNAAPTSGVTPAPISRNTPSPARAAVDASPANAPRLEQFFRRMVQEHCSDLHLCSGCPPLFRQDGAMVTLGPATPLVAETVREMLLEITPAGHRAEFESRHDTDFSYEIPGLARYRCNLFLDRRGMGGVFRVIPAKIPNAQSLGLSKPMLDLCDLSKGLVLVTGPTGSGKSTTLAAMIDHINNTRSDHIITVEDPIEFMHENRKCLVNQREVGGHTKDFKSALRAALREDPDIVLVGEMRDLETMEIAIETAETGHLVFGTLHTNTAASTVDRIIDQFPGDRQNQVRSMLADSLKGVISQTLCKKKGGGMVAAHEVLLVNAAVSNLVREGKTFQIPTIMQTGRAAGMTTLNDSLLELVKQGIVEPNQAYAKSVARSEFRALLERNHFRVDAA